MGSFLFLLLTSCLAINSTDVMVKPMLHTMKDCSSSSHIGHITSLTMDPSAPVSGQYVLISMDYLLDSDVTGGTAKYTASFNGFPFTPTVNDLCTDLAETNTPCPLLAGPIHFESINQIGDGTTHGTIDAKVTWTDSANVEILCWEFVVRV